MRFAGPAIFIGNYLELLIGILRDVARKPEPPAPS
jgi:hypothetical protein